MLKPWTTRFLQLALDREALRFGRFTLKSGRESPYFFNAGEFSTGSAIDTLARCYADAIVDAGVAFDMLFGPAYKGIPLAATVALSLSRDHGLDVPFAYDRKEAKAHGEGGLLVGAPLAGRVLIVDDVISAGTSVQQGRNLIDRSGAQACAVAIALDRQERGLDDRSAVAAVRSDGLDVVSVATLDDLITWLDQQPAETVNQSAMLEYRRNYGVEA
jgi:orotate phosphoribosyltransferase